ncbi:TPA: hypothetical protein ACX3FR_004181 [Vibrio parahaemolyticus]
MYTQLFRNVWDPCEPQNGKRSCEVFFLPVGVKDDNTFYNGLSLSHKGMVELTRYQIGYLIDNIDLIKHFADEVWFSIEADTLEPLFFELC